MATLQTIRDRAGVLVAGIIGLALLAFVLGDFFGQGSGPTLGSKKMYEIAEIDGKSISYQSFDQKIQNLTEIYKLTGQTNMDEAMVENIREQTWQQLIREYVLEQELEKLGLMISPDEMFDLVQGAEPHPFIQQLFTDPQTGQLNRAGLMQFLKTLDNDPAQRAYWLFLENEILQDREFTKYNNLIRQGLYVTKRETEAEQLATNKKVNFSYLIKRLTSIPDSLVTFTENDLDKYYRENRNNYKQTASRNIEYVAFDIVPSTADIKAAKDWINNIIDEFREAENVEQFVNLSSDTPFDNRNLKLEEVPGMIREFVGSASIGDVFGPYFENETYKLSKLAEINYLPDSVHSRHILITPSQTLTYDQAKQEADSLKVLIEAGTDFGLIALINSDDQGSAQLGGDLGWFREGTMVQPFNDACFEGKPGDITVVETQFGFHIIEILEQGNLITKYKTGTIERTIDPSSSTYQMVYSEASKFAGTSSSYEEFNQSIIDQQIEKRLANDIKMDDKVIPGLESPRALIRSIFETDEGEIVLDFSEQAVFELGDKFIVAYVTQVKEEGFASLSQVLADVELSVRKEKKTEMIAQEFQVELSSVESLEELSTKMNLSVSEANDITFNSFSIPGAGIEPAVIATAVNLPQNTLSKPIIGTNGVYVIVVNEIEEPEGIDLESIRTRLASSFRVRANYEAFEALKKAAHIVDSRSKFY
jgi:peptidyl-prolyl cis-trans isomerase D